MHLSALHLPAQSLVAVVLVGLVAGWTAAKFVQHGLGIVGDIIVGVIGAYVGNWALPRLKRRTFGLRQLPHTICKELCPDQSLRPSLR